MAPRAHSHRDTKLLPLALLALLAVSGCSSIGDYGRLRDDLVTDNIHAWVGRDAAASVGAPISHLRLTDDERLLRDLAFPLIESPFDRQRWDAVIHEYGVNHFFHRDVWTVSNVGYYAELQWKYRRSETSRYNLLIDDIRNDIVRLDPFFTVARRVVDMDRRREAAMANVADLSPSEVVNAKARVGENSLTIAWVYHSLNARCAAYRFALEHLSVAEPDPAAGEADLVLAQLQQQIAANQLVPAPRFAAVTKD
jgi:hypothetical protein